MATLATSITNARAEVPGANTTNMPDATLLVPANSIYQFLALMEPRMTRQSPTAMGWALSAPAAGTRVKTSTYAKFARITAVHDERGASTPAIGTDSAPLQFLPRDQFEMEVATYPGTAGIARCFTIYPRNPDGTWTMAFHPAADGILDYNFCPEGEIEVTLLTATSDTVILSQPMIATFDLLLAAWIARQLGKDDSFISQLLTRVPDQRAVEKWLSVERGRTDLVHGEDRGRP